jgi:hypothetical protein
MTLLQEKQMLVQMCDTTHWGSVIALTLNLKQSIPTGIGGFVPLDELMAKKAFRQYMHALNRRTTVTQASNVMWLKIWAAILPSEWSRSFTALTVPGRPS